MRPKIGGFENAKATFSPRIRTGPKSGLLVLDIDARHNGEKSLSALEDKLGPLPEGPRVKTGGGQHRYFSYPGVGVKSRAGIGGVPGCDVRAKKGYVVAPPSLHRSGLRYSWQSEVNGKLPALPKAWIKYLVGHNTTVPIAENRRDSGKLCEGFRNDRLTRLAGALRRQRANEKTILAALVEFNENQCNPPLTEAEVGKIAASALSIVSARLGRQFTVYCRRKRSCLA
jgi:putative DNA primase/helicase